jgi:DNA repair exonuclease SbcCD ATPase subunit
LQAILEARDKDVALEAHKVLQKEHDRLTSQQTHWDDLHRATEQIETLTTLIGQADNEEVKELRRVRDRFNKLESEHTALQKRIKDQESKVANSERSATIARQSLAQAQQRASEWERRAKEHEGELEMTRTKLDQADQTHAQLDADYSLVQLRLEEREADDRLAKVCSTPYFEHQRLMTHRIGRTTYATKSPHLRLSSHALKWMLLKPNLPLSLSPYTQMARHCRLLDRIHGPVQHMV